MFKLIFPTNKLRAYAEKYPAENDHEVEFVLAPNVRKRGYATKAEFEKICYWKTPRSQKKVASNTAEYIETITQTALSTKSEQLRIEILTLLNGVSWPTASVILHFCHGDLYPILDFRALWSLGVDKVTYNFLFWQEYTKVCRQLAYKT